MGSKLSKGKWISILSILSLLSNVSNAQGNNPQEGLPALINDSGFVLTAMILLILLIVIIAMSKTTVSIAKAVQKIKGKSGVTVLLLLFSFSSFAQGEVVPEKINKMPDWFFDSQTYLLGFVFLIFLITIFVLQKVNMRLINSLMPQEEITEETEMALATDEPTLLRRIYLRMVDSVPVKREQDILLDHDYDGIKELDNNLPPWWKYGFYLTIVFAFVYLLSYHVFGTGKLQAQEYKDELLLAQQQKEERMRLSADNVNEENVIAFVDAERISDGKEIFSKNCVACHRADAGGLVGPNLTDEFWLHGGGIKNIFKTITYGVPDKGMLSWQSQLAPKQIQDVASYILTLKGTNPVDPKEPQGEKWQEPIKVSPDSLIVASADTIHK